MAVVVKIPTQHDGRRTAEHSEGTELAVHDQHLFVENQAGAVAVYAPGQWYSAKIEQGPPLSRA